MAEQIEGKIAQILSESVVVINVGGDKGVTPGMPFVILAEGDEVTDPDTGASLGRWEMPKGHIRAAHVQPKISVCEAVAPKSDDDASKGDPTTRTLSASMIAVSMRGRDQGGKLRVRAADIAGMPEIPPIKVGDKVRSLPETS